MTGPYGTMALSEPPEGALTGDSVPRENEGEEGWRKTKVDKVVAQLKTKKKYREMKDKRVRKKAEEIVKEASQ